jgi:hypothetical protein
MKRPVAIAICLVIFFLGLIAVAYDMVRSARELDRQATAWKLRYFNCIDSSTECSNFEQKLDDQADEYPYLYTEERYE